MIGRVWAQTAVQHEQIRTYTVNTNKEIPMKAFPRHLLAITLGAVAFASVAGVNSVANAQTYPSKPIKIITPFSAGSGPDAVLRVVSEKMTKDLGQQVLVDNRPGGNGFIALQAGKAAAADGYTFVQMDDAHMSLLPLLYKNVPYNVTRDFDPAGTFFKTYFFISSSANSPWKNVADLVAAAKAKPGELTYGSWFVGSPGHVGAVLLESATGTQMTHIPFKETPMVYQSVSTGDVAWAFGTAGSAGPLYRGKKLKFLAVAAPKRVPGFADVPIVAEAGGPANFEVIAWVALQAPKGTPTAAIAKFNASLAKALAEPDVREKFGTFGFEPFISAPSDLPKMIEADGKRYADIIKRAKISIE
jgi:tripartite-type tricarboxylate transporter receptor subunit TctC